MSRVKTVSGYTFFEMEGMSTRSCVSHSFWKKASDSIARILHPLLSWQGPQLYERAFLNLRIAETHYGISSKMERAINVLWR